MSAQPAFASLNAGLLARKGEARPAQSQTSQSQPVQSEPIKMLADMGIQMLPKTPANGTIDHEAPTKGDTATQSPKTIVSEIVDEDVLEWARVSFRMPMADYLRLKMAGQVLGKTGRSIILDALSAYCTAAGIPDFTDCEQLKAPVETA